ncbi:MAG: DUF1552 domain-containing protein [Pirellulales bacterium]
MMLKSQVSRRVFLRGIGTSVALPLLESQPMVAAPSPLPQPPKRMAFIYIPNGVQIPEWTPKREGANYTLPPTLEPLKPFQNNLLVLSGLTHDKARGNNDGGGDHARSCATFLTGVQPVKSGGADIRLGPSVDQIAAGIIGQNTPLASLELGADRGAKPGLCDSGYSCAYSHNISWRSEKTPMPKETDPRVVFERLFGRNDTRADRTIRMQRRQERCSVLDFVRDQARRLESRVNVKDRQKLDEYFTGIREVERQLKTDQSRPQRRLNLDAAAPPAGIPDTYRDHLRLMSDMMVLAFQGDITRVSTFMFSNAGSNRNYRFIDVPEGHHELSHHGGDLKKQAKLAKINRFHIEQFGYLLGRLQSIPEGDGTLLDQCMIVYGCGMSDGNKHNHNDLPILLAGSGGGTIDSGRHLRYPQETPLTNLYVSMLGRVGVQVGNFGDSTGILDQLNARLPHLP